MSTRTRPRTLRPLRYGAGTLCVRYYDADGTEHLVAAQNASAVDFASCTPARDIPSYVGQHHTPGLYWSASSDRHVAYESFLELKWMKLLDHDPHVALFTSQPFTLKGADAHGRWRHTLDLFVRRTDGSVLIVDVKNPLSLSKPSVIQQADRTAEACRRIGWDYQMVGDIAPQRWANIEWLAGYRRPLRSCAHLADPLLALADRPVAVGDLVSFQPAPELARPVVYHLLWHNRLACDLDQPLRDHTRVWTTGKGEA